MVTRTRREGRRLLAAVILLSQLMVLTLAVDWPMFRGDAAGTGAIEEGPLVPMEQAWNHTTGMAVHGSAAVGFGMVYIASWDGYLYALDAGTGEEKWRHKTGVTEGGTPAAWTGERAFLFFGSGDGQLYAFNARMGYIEWNFTTGEGISSSPAVADGVVYVGSDDDNVYALEALTGEWKWTFPTGGSVRSSPAVADGRVFVGSQDRHVHAIDAASGTQLWNVSTGDYVDSSPAVVNGTVYVGSSDDHLYALEAASGAEVWKRDLEGSVTSSPAVADGRVIVGTEGNRVVALDARTGDELWEYPVDRMVPSSPSIAGGVVFVGDYSGLLHALDAATGSSLGSFQAGREIVSSPAITEDMVYFGSGDRRVYALTTAEADVSEGPQAPEGTVSSTDVPTPVPLANGKPRTAAADCASDNCLSGVCCLAGKACCITHGDCQPTEYCDAERFYCVVDTGAAEGTWGYFMQYWELAAALLASMGIVGYYLHQLKRKAIGEEAVSVKRGVTWEGNLIKIGVKVVNDSTFTLVDVGVHLEVPEAFKVESGTPAIDLGTIKQGEFQSAIFTLVPTRCVSGNITGSVQYHNLKGERKVVEMSPVTVASVCPFLEPVPLTYDQFLARSAALPGSQKRIPIAPGTLSAVLERLAGKCSAMNPVVEASPGDEGGLVGMYAARGAYSKNLICMRLDTGPGSSELVVTMYGEQTEMVTGLMAEVVELAEEVEPTTQT